MKVVITESQFKYLLENTSSCPEGKKENAVIVHNNFMVGVEIKMQKFKEEKLWFL